MISPELRFDHLDPVEWRRVQRLLLPPERPGAGHARRSAAHAPLILLLDGDRVSRAIRAASPDDVTIEDPAKFPWAGPHSLGRLRRAAGARLAIAVEEQALERIAARLDRSLSAADDLGAQGLAALRAARAELGRGLHLDPDPFSPIPVPSFAALQQTLDLLHPDDRSVGLFVFDRGRLWTSVIAEKRRGDICRITSHRALGVEISDFAGGRHKGVLEAMGRRVAPPHAALFTTLDAWRDIAGPEPGMLAQKVALRQAVLDPAPPWLVALTGAAAMAGMAQTAGRLFGRFVPQTLKDTARSLTATPFAALGFDPIQLYADLRGLF